MRSDMAARRANDETGCSTVMFSSIQVSTGVRLSDEAPPSPPSATGVSALGRDGGDARIGGDCCAQSCSDSSSSSAGARMIHSPRTGWRVQYASTTGGIWGRESAGGRRYL